MVSHYFISLTSITTENLISMLAFLFSKSLANISMINSKALSLLALICLWNTFVWQPVIITNSYSAEPKEVICWNRDIVFVLVSSWCGPGPQGPCVVAKTNKFTWTKEVLWRKRDHMATLWVREGLDACLGRLLLLLFLGTLHRGWPLFTMHRFTLGGYLLPKTKERMLLITSKKKDIYKCKGKSGWTGYTSPWEV